MKTRPSSPITTALQCRASGAGRGRVSSDRARAARLVFASRFSFRAAISVFPDADPFRCSERARRAWFVQTDFCPTGLTDPPRLTSRTLCATLLRTRLSIRLLCAALLRTRPPAPRADMYSRRPALRERKIRMPPFSALVRAPAPAPPPNLDAIRGTSLRPPRQGIWTPFATPPHHQRRNPPRFAALPRPRPAIRTLFATALRPRRRIRALLATLPRPWPPIRTLFAAPRQVRVPNVTRFGAPAVNPDATCSTSAAPEGRSRQHSRRSGDPGRQSGRYSRRPRDPGPQSGRYPRHSRASVRKKGGGFPTARTENRQTTREPSHFCDLRPQ